jgi:MFS family permease
MEATVLSVVPLYLYRTLGERNVAIAGLAGFLVLGLGAITPFLIERLDPRHAVMLGVGVSSLITTLVVAASGLSAVALVVFAAAGIGFFNGFILQGGTVIAGTVVPLQERGKLLSALYMCAYAGTTPIVVLGFLSGSFGLTVALAFFSAAAMALAAWVLLVGRRLFPEVIPHVETIGPRAPDEAAAAR